jgi:hypothetical protein
MARRNARAPDAGADPADARGVAGVAGRVGRAGRQGLRRTSTYTPEIAEQILQMMADGISTPKIADQLKIGEATIYAWIIDDYEGFGKRYARAKHIVALRWADEISDIADHKRDDYVVNEEGKMVLDMEAVARSRLRIDTRKWLLSKVLPKVYGERIITEITGKDGGPIETQATRIDVLALQPEQRDQLKLILQQATKGKTEDEGR